MTKKKFSGLLQWIDCKKCEKQYLVGLNGIDIRKGLDEPAYEGGTVNGTPYVAIGNEELVGREPIQEKVHCQMCGEEYEVQDSAGQEKIRRIG